jgi:hypothetical protein
VTTFPVLFPFNGSPNDGMVYLGDRFEVVARFTEGMLNNLQYKGSQQGGGQPDALVELASALLGNGPEIVHALAQIIAARDNSRVKTNHLAEARKQKSKSKLESIQKAVVKHGFEKLVLRDLSKAQANEFVKRAPSLPVEESRQVLFMLCSRMLAGARVVVWNWQNHLRLALYCESASQAAAVYRVTTLKLSLLAECRECGEMFIKATPQQRYPDEAHSARHRQERRRKKRSPK